MEERLQVGKATRSTPRIHPSLRALVWQQKYVLLYKMITITAVSETNTNNTNLLSDLLLCKNQNFMQSPPPRKKMELLNSRNSVYISYFNNFSD